MGAADQSDRAVDDPDVWTRHIADSLQLLPLRAGRQIWVDLGSGAGFPGLVIACALADRAGATVHLVESIGKKAAFLREAVKHLQLPAVVHAVRIEDFVKNFQRQAGRCHRPRAGSARRIADAGAAAAENGCTRSVSQGTRCRG